RGSVSSPSSCRLRGTTTRPTRTPPNSTEPSRSRRRGRSVQVFLVGRYAVDRLNPIAHADRGKGDGQPLPGPRGGAIHELGVHVRLAAVAGVAATTDHLAGSDPVADADRRGVALQVSSDREGAVLRLQHHVVA